VFLRATQTSKVIMLRLAPDYAAHARNRAAAAALLCTG
jgi:hypothetical protein